MPTALPYPRALLILILSAVVVGRGLARALPGTFVGANEVTERVELLGALLTQLAALASIFLAVRNSGWLLFTRHDHPGLRLASASAAALITAMTVISALLSHNQLAPEWSLLGALASSGLLIAASLTVLGHSERRAVGVIGMAIAAAALLHTGARVLALVAADRASPLGFAVAQSLATSGLALELACLAAASLWLLVPSSTWTRAGAVFSLVLVPALALAATRPEGPGLLLHRTLQQLSSHPDPLLPEWLRHSVELWGLSVVLLCALSRVRSELLLGVLGMSLLARSSADVPLGALFLLNAALALQLLPKAQRAATAQGADSASTP